MLCNTTQEGMHQMYLMYHSNEYPEFFRHFDDFMNEQQFLLALIQLGNLMEIRENDEFIGMTAVALNPKTRAASIGIGIKKEHQRQGKAAMYVKEIADYLFSKGLLRLIVICSRDDERTMYLLEKAKFLPEARLRGNCFYDGKLHDEMRWVMPRDVYFKQYKQGE